MVESGKNETERNTALNFNGIITAVITFLLIGLFHPIVIKTQYYFGDGVWPVFLVVGAALVVGSLFVENILISVALGAAGCSCLWSIGELKEQTERVRKGWFPDNPNRKNKKQH